MRQKQKNNFFEKKIVGIPLAVAMNLGMLFFGVFIFGQAFAYSPTCNDLTKISFPTAACNSGEVCYQGQCQTLQALGIGAPQNGGTCTTNSNSVVTQIQTKIGMTGTDIDGICGANTITAIQRYQKSQGLTADGLLTANGNTDKALGYVLENGVAPPPGGSNPPAGGGGCPNGTSPAPGSGICLPSNAPSTGIAGASSLADLILLVINILLIFAGLIAVVMIVVGGFQYITAGGNEENSEKGKKVLINAVIGLVVVLLAFTIVRVINATLTTDQGNILKSSSTTGG